MSTYLVMGHQPDGRVYFDTIKAGTPEEAVRTTGLDIIGNATDIWVYELAGKPVNGLPFRPKVEALND